MELRCGNSPQLFVFKVGLTKCPFPEINAGRDLTA